MENVVVVGAGVGGAMAKLWSAEEPESTSLGGFATGVSPTWTGVSASVVVPLPSSLRPLYPHAYRLPSEPMARLWSAPAAIDVAVTPRRHRHDDGVLLVGEGAVAELTVGVVPPRVDLAVRADGHAVI